MHFIKQGRTAALAVAAAVVAAALAGCSSNGAGSTGVVNKTLTWYSTIQAQDAQPLLNAFKQQTGITVNLYTTATPTLWQKFAQEESSGRHTASVFSTTNGQNVQDGVDKGYLAKLPSTITSSYPSDDVTNGGYSIATRITIMGIVYNTKLVTGANVPKTWSDLLKPFWKNKITVSDPQLTTTGYFTDYQLLQDKSLGMSYLKSLGAQKVKIEAHSGQQVNDVIDGDAYAAITSDDAVWPEVQTGAPVKMVYPSEGVGNYADYNSIVKNAPNKSGAEKFVKFLASTDAGELFAKSGAYSPLPAVKPLPSGRPPLSSLTLFPADTLQALKVQSSLLGTLQKLGLATTS